MEATVVVATASFGALIGLLSVWLAVVDLRLVIDKAPGDVEIRRVALDVLVQEMLWLFVVVVFLAAASVSMLQTPSALTRSVTLWMLVSIPGVVMVRTMFVLFRRWRVRANNSE